MDSASRTTQTKSPGQLMGSLLSWYAVCTTKSLKQDFIYFFSIFNEPLALYRDKGCRPVCIKDFCPHRGASFRGGEVNANEIICPYHGARFGFENGCEHTKITCQHIVDSTYANYSKRTFLYQYPCIEKDGYIYIFYSGKPKTDLSLNENRNSLIPLLLESHGFNRSEYVYEEALLDFKCDWSRIVENHLDILHIFWMHGQSLPGNEVGRHTITRFDQHIEVNNEFMHIKYFHKHNPTKEFISQIFIPPGRIIMYKGNLKAARYVQVLDHLPLSENRARVIVRHYRKFLKNQLLSNLILFEPLQKRTYYKIFSEDYLVLKTQTYNLQMGYMQDDTIKLLSEDRFLKIYWEWYDKSISSQKPWSINPLPTNVNPVHQDLLMVYPPEHSYLVRRNNRVILIKLFERLLGVLIFTMILYFLFLVSKSL